MVAWIPLSQIPGLKRFELKGRGNGFLGRGVLGLNRFKVVVEPFKNVFFGFRSDLFRLSFLCLLVLFSVFVEATGFDGLLVLEEGGAVFYSGFDLDIGFWQVAAFFMLGLLLADLVPSLFRSSGESKEKAPNTGVEGGEQVAGEGKTVSGKDLRNVSSKNLLRRPVKSSVLVCSNCGTENDAYYTYCSHCVNKLK